MRAVLVGILCGLLAAPLMATNAVYIAQSAAGGNTGVDCANAKAASYFNTSGNWSATPSGIQIGPDTTVHLCGTFTGTISSTMLTVQGSGSSGHPVILLFETGAQFNAPYWDGNNGAIFCDGFNYITLDGGANGLIQNTANGTGLAYQADSIGVKFNNCGHNEIRNLTVQNIYVHTGTGSDLHGIGIADQNIPDVASVHGNSVIYAVHDLDINTSNGVTSLLVYGNTLDYTGQGIAIGDESGGSSSASGIEVYGNNIGPHFDIMLDAAQTVHGDGIIVSWPDTMGGTLSNSCFYNNYIHGDLSAASNLNSTAYLFFTGTGDHICVFNNVLGQDNVNVGAGGPEGLVRISGTNFATGSWTNFLFANNTLYGVSNGSNNIPQGIKFESDTITSQNNVFSNTASGYLNNSTGMPLTSNFNDFFGFLYLASQSGGIYYNTLAAWQASGFDANGSGGNPLLSGSYIPMVGSAAIGLGTNLTSLAITALNSDKNGNARPGSGPWTAGAFNATANTPIILPATGIYTSSQTVTMSCSSPSPTIYYTTDNSTPTHASTVYSSGFSQVVPGTVKAICASSSLADSPVATSSYTAQGTFAPVVQFSKEIAPGAIGNWQGQFGLDGYDIPNAPPALPSYVTVKPVNAFTWTWESETNDTRGLLLNGMRSASCWYNTPPFYLDINFTDGKTHPLEAYFCDWDSYLGARAETVTLTDAVTGKILDTRTLSNFQAGAWISWNVSGHLRLNVTRTAGVNGVVSAVMFG